MTRLFLVTFLLLLAASEAPRVQLRYQPAPQSRWQTEGTLTVRSWIGWPDGEKATTEELDVSWSDLVTESGAGKIVLTRSISRWDSRGSLQAPASSAPYLVTVTDLLGLRERDLLDQPELYPIEDVSPGESWSIRQPATLELLPLGDRNLVLSNSTRGTGRISRLDDDLAIIEVDATTESVGEANDLASRSLTRTHWWLEVDRSEGVPLQQKIEVQTTQTLTLGQVRVPSRLDTVWHLTTRRQGEQGSSSMTWIIPALLPLR